MKTTASHRLVMKGDTKPSKEMLKARGWKWSPELTHWYMYLVDAHADRLKAGDMEFLRGLAGCRTGCQVLLDSSIIWTSKTYSEAHVASNGSYDGSYDVHAGDIWNHDQFGNPIKSKRIAGSAPEDRI